VVATNWKVYLRVRGFLANWQFGWGIWVFRAWFVWLPPTGKFICAFVVFWPTGNLVGVFGFLGLGLCGCHQLESLFARSWFFGQLAIWLGYLGF
jgi:hypothetical protein